jgi:hypothetical protein
MNRLPASPRDKRHQRRWKRYEKQRPGHQLQIDVTFVEPITTDTGRKRRFYQYTAIDDCTRLRIYPRSDQKTATGVPELRAVPIFFMRASPSLDCTSHASRRSYLWQRDRPSARLPSR